MNFRWTLVFLGAVSLLALFTFYDFKKAGEEGEKKDQAKSVVRYKAEEIQKIELITRLTTTVLERKGDGWELSAGPLQDHADPTVINNFLLVLSQEKFAQKVAGPEGVKLDTYGLDQPLMRMKLATTDGRGEELKVGSVRAYDGSLYAQVDNEPAVYLIGSNWDAYLSKKASDLRDKHLIRHELSEAKRIEIRSSLGRTELSLKEGKWTLTQGDTLKGYPISEERVKAYLEQVKGLRGNEFLSEKEKLDKIQFEVAIYGTKPEPIGALKFSPPLPVVKSAPNVKLAQAPPDMRAFSSDLPVLMQLPESLATALKKTGADFYDLKLPFRLGGAEADVKKIEIDAPGVLKGTFEKNGESWVSTDPGLQPDVDATKLNELLTKLAGLEAKEVGVKFAAGKAPESHLRLKKASGETLFDFGWVPAPSSSKDKLLTARTNLVEPAFSLSADAIQTLDLAKIVKPKPSPSPSPL